MKRGLVLFGLILFGVNSVASAQELGNPARLIPAKQFSVGVQGTWIFDQDFGDYDLGWTNSDGSAGTTRKSTTFENDQCYMATITYGLIDRVNLFARLGVVNGGEFKESSPGNEWKASLGTNFVWAIGAKGKVYELKNGIGFGVSAQYLRYDDRTLDSWKDVTDGITAEQDGWSTDDNVDYWQVDAIATVYWTIDRFTYAHTHPRATRTHPRNTRAPHAHHTHTPHTHAHVHTQTC